MPNFKLKDMLPKMRVQSASISPWPNRFAQTAAILFLGFGVTACEFKNYFRAIENGLVDGVKEALDVAPKNSLPFVDRDGTNIAESAIPEVFLRQVRKIKQEEIDDLGRPVASVVETQIDGKLLLSA